MLVLSRKKNQVLRIGDEVTLKVLEIRGGVVRIGIEAPDHVNILRGELAIAIADDRPEVSGVATAPQARRNLSACPR